jgi:hypothetical protein
MDLIINIGNLVSNPSGKGTWTELVAALWQCIIAEVGNYTTTRTWMRMEVFNKSQ